MSPRSPRFPTPASGDDADAGGRHRRPESLADLTRARVAGNGSRALRLGDFADGATGGFGGSFTGDFQDSFTGDFEDSFIERGFAAPTRRGEALGGRRRAVGRRGRTPGRRGEVLGRRGEVLGRRGEALGRRGEALGRRGEAFGRRGEAFGRRAEVSARRGEASGRRASRHQRNVLPGRHAAGVHSGAPPVTGSHRAPGTLPIESWLLVGKTRQQMMLASLVAVALLMVAIPSQERRAGVDAVNAAAQRAVGAHATGKQSVSAKPKTTKGKQPPTAGHSAAPAPSASAPASSPASTAPVTSAAMRIAGRGPGNSLRTTGSNTIALTFDDGPDPVQTPKILALLHRYGLKATFCLVGRQVRKHPEIVREIVAAGHTLCNHTWDHSLTIGKDEPDKIQEDLAKASAAIHAAAPGAKIPFFRAPGGNFTDRLVSVAAADGMTSLYWEVDPQDWNHLAGETDAAHVARVVDDIRGHARPGAIILSHDFNQPDTIEAYTRLLPWLVENFQIGLPEVPATSPSAPSATPSSPAPSSSAPPSGGTSAPPQPTTSSPPVPEATDASAAR
jgi:peptidoglycan/xylan/chitin deacetylase (PgdA/CDA1 family)